MSLKESLENTSWSMLDKVGLSDFFDNHYLNPMLFPAIIIAVLLIIAFFLMMPAEIEPEIVCGDGTCSLNEDCPEDCGEPISASKDIKIDISGAIKCNSLSVLLINSENGDIIEVKETGSRVVTFKNVSTENVYVEVSSPNSALPAMESIVIDTTKEKTIRVSLLDDYCEGSNSEGSLKVILKNQAGESVDGSVSVFQSGGSKKDTKDVDGELTFTNLPSDEWYYVTVIATGYKSYDGSSKSVFIKGGETKIADVVLEPYEGAAIGDLEVCVQTTKDVTGAKIAIYDVAGDMVTSGLLEEGEDCITFALDAGGSYSAAVISVPVGCAISGKTVSIPIIGGTTQQTNITIDCNRIGYINAIVYGNNSKILTENCTVELFYADSTLIKTLTVGEDTTETVPLPEGVEVYAYASNVPSGYFDSESEKTIVENQVNTTLVITLDTPIKPLPNLTMHNIDLSDQILDMREVLNISVGMISLDQVKVLPEDGVKVECESSWGEKAIASYAKGWLCNLTAPEVPGTGQVTVKAIMKDTNPDVRVYDLLIAEEDVFPLTITTDEFNTGESPVSMKFKITLENEENLASLYDSSVLLVYTESDGVASKTTLTGSKGSFETSAKVPFAGYYDYTVNARGFIDGYWYVGLKQGRIQVLKGSEGALSCDIDPRIAAPGEEIIITAELRLDGTTIGEQDLVVKIDEGLTDSTYTLNWDKTTGEYSQNILTSSKECTYNITCYPLADFTIAQELELYVVDPTVSGVDELDCPVNPLNCGTLKDARSCYKFIKGSEAVSASDMNLVVTCADNGLASCNAAITCGNLQGDMNNDGVVDPSDESLLQEVLVAYSASQSIYYDPWPPECADVNEDGKYTDEDVECLTAIITPGMSTEEYCMTCESGIVALDRQNPLDVTLEICHDGLDNNCDGIKEENDPNCVCNANTPCNILRDDDGTYNTEDFSICRSYGKTTFSNMETSWNAYEWKNAAAVEAHDCSSRGKEAWGETERCSATENWVSCLWTFDGGFTMDDQRGAFDSIGEVANAGPLGVLVNCDSCNSCPSGWEEIGTSHSGVCGCGIGGGDDCDSATDSMGCRQYDESNYPIPGDLTDSFDDGQTYTITPGSDNQLRATEDTDGSQCDATAGDTCVSYSCSSYCYTYCRFKNDPCAVYGGGSIECGPSGGSRTTEACSNDIQCMGAVKDF